MVRLCFLLLLTIYSTSAYPPVSFVRRPSTILEERPASSYSTITVHSRPPPAHKRGNIVSRSIGRYGHSIASYGTTNEIVHNGVYVAASPINNAVVEIGRGGHLTPDFSNGLDYPDPFLLTGVAAEAVAKLLYSHELFFGDYPHLSAVLRNQQIRRDNGLEGHRLGSIRPDSPFFRYRSRYVYAR